MKFFDHFHQILIYAVILALKMTQFGPFSPKMTYFDQIDPINDIFDPFWPIFHILNNLFSVFIEFREKVPGQNFMAGFWPKIGQNIGKFPYFHNRFLELERS